MTPRPDTYFAVAKRGVGGYRVDYHRLAARPLTVFVDTTHDVAACAWLCEAVVISDDINVRQACRAIRVRTLWPEEVQS